MENINLEMLHFLMFKHCMDKFKAGEASAQDFKSAMELLDRHDFDFSLDPELKEKVEDALAQGELDGLSLTDEEIQELFMKV